jgi:hypothetical protein
MSLFINLKLINNLTKHTIMTKIMSLALILFVIVANAQSITFMELEFFKTKSVSSIQLSLKDNNYTYYMRLKTVELNGRLKMVVVQ